MSSIDVVGIRLVKERDIKYDRKLNSVEDAVEVIANEMKYLDREVMMVANLDNHNRIINTHIVNVGGINFSFIDPKNVFKAALLSNATKIMLVHNHPSGSCKPSNEDIQMTESMKKLGELMTLPLLDHIIIGSHSYYSITADMEYEYDLFENEESIDFDIEME